MAKAKPGQRRKMAKALGWAMGGSLVALASLPAAAHAAPATAQQCVAGTWRAIAGGADDMPVQYETAHFAFRWKPGTVQPADAVSAGKVLEYILAFDVAKTAFPMPFCDATDKHKANVNLDPSFGLTGGPTGERDMGMWIGPSALKDNWGLAHEFAHALQGSTRSLRDTPYGGWLWESHANWMAHQLPMFRDNPHCSQMLANFPHLYYGSTRDRYCNWQFLEYVKDRYGYGAVNGIWANARKPGDAGYAQEDPFLALMRNQKWDIAQLNTVFGEWALHNVHWDYTDADGRDQGAVYRRDYGPNTAQDGERFLRSTRLDPVDLAQRRFAVPLDWAPQRWGYNLVRLVPDAGAQAVTVTFAGQVQHQPAVATLPGMADEPATIAPPASDWRWGVVVVGADGASRISPLQAGARGTLSVALRPDDAGVYLVVMATPAAYQPIAWEQPSHSVYRYPWMAQFAGALPDGFGPSGDASLPKGHRHPNGGGFVADGAHVAASAYVGPYARVLAGSVAGQARIEDHAVVAGGSVADRAVVGGLTNVSRGVVVKDDAVVRTNFMPLGQFEPGAVIGGTAKLYGDVELREAPKLTHGAYTGFVDPAAQNDPKRGSQLADIPKPVTATPPAIWVP